MNLRNALIGSIWLPVAWFTAGCDTTLQVRTTQPLGTLDAAPDYPNKGYVEFMTTAKTLPFPIFQLDDRLQPFVLAGVGLKEGDLYSYRRYQMPVVENLRVAEPPGTNLFVIETHGQTLEVPVEAGLITPVEINYVLVEAGNTFKVYQLDYRIFAPVPYQPEKLAAAARPEK